VDVSTAGAAGAAPWPAWVRRCMSCGTDDLRALFGRAAVPSDGAADEPWWCPACRSGAWEAVLCRLPAACPHAETETTVREGRP